MQLFVLQFKIISFTDIIPTTLVTMCISFVGNCLNWDWGRVIVADEIEKIIQLSVRHGYETLRRHGWKQVVYPWQFLRSVQRTRRSTFYRNLRRWNLSAI